jgi:hypothetical protein
VIPLPSIDEMYDDFVRGLPVGLAETARALPFLLGLAPAVDVTWGQVFSHEVTLGAPALVAEGMPQISPEVVRAAALAHLLAIVEAFGTDRLLDGQVAPSAALDGILGAARAARDAALSRVGAADEGFARADAQTAAAIRAERGILDHGEAVSWSRYLAVARAKQRLGLPASLALARAAGWDARRRRALAALLDDIWVGLQLHDDVVDWESDLARGGAWAAALAAHVPHRDDPRDRKTMPVSTRRLVLESGALARMLRHSERCFCAARRRAAALGLARLAAWARGREEALAALAGSEAESPGKANRARVLAHWADLVLP